MIESEFLNIDFSRDELKSIFSPENPVSFRSCHKPRINKKLNVAHFSQQHQVKIYTVGKFHPYHQNNGQDNAPDDAQYETHHVEDVHVVHNIGPNFNQGVNEYIHNNLTNAQNYVTREEFIEFKELINDRFDRLERSIQALGERNFNNEERKKRKRKR